MSTLGTADRFSRTADRRSALDRAHIGDIRGAAGTVRATDTGPRRTRRRQLATLLAIAGPGLFVMAADNDAGTMTVLAQAGRSYGLDLVWVLIALAPVLYVGQEMAARLGAVTGVGHARLVRERFGRGWCAFSLGNLAVLNLLLLITEFIGVATALATFGVARDISVPIAALALTACTAGGSFPRWERAMWLLVGAELVVIPLAVLHHAPIGHPLLGATAARPRAGSAVLMLVALVGTTICPWQIFFQQSNVIDKRITPRWLRYERIDTACGTALFVVIAIAVMALCATLSGGAGSGHLVLSDAATLDRLLGAHLGRAVAVGFALALLGASLLGAVAVSLSTSYAASEVLGYKHSLHRSLSDARRFHGAYVVQVIVAAGIVLIPSLPLGAVTTLVQAFAGVLLPSVLALLLMLCNDPEVLGPLTNPRWLNAVAGVALCAILALSTTLTVTAVLPRLGISHAVMISLGLIGAGAAALWACPSAPRTSGERRTGELAGLAPWERLTWSAPHLERLRPATVTPRRALALGLLRAYTIVALIALLAHLGTLAAGRG